MGIMAIYLDHAATTRLLPEVLEGYIVALSAVGNASSIHSHGQAAKRMLEEARERVAVALGCDPVEVIFTSGGTESINTAVKGIYWARRDAGSRILLPAGEHHATADAAAWLAAGQGAVVEGLALDPKGLLDPAVLEAALAEGGAALVSAAWANSEVGTVQPIAELAALARRSGVPMHADAVAAFGQVPVDFRASGLSALSVTGHKVGAPVGTGALVLARGTTAQPLVHGGGQQRGVRSGTQDVAGAVAFGIAASLAVERLAEHAAALAVRRARLVAGVLATVPGARLRGAAPGPARLPGNAHFTFDGCDGDSLLLLLDLAGISVSTGAACQAGVPEVSSVLLAMGLAEPEARGALRFSVGADTTDDDVDALLCVLPGIVERAQRAGHSDRVPVLR